MTISIGSNILAKRTLRQLDLTSQKLNTSFERLSSGQRINRAVDDAAGLAVSESLRVGVAIKNRALLNVNDGISITDLVGGAANSISSLLTRMAELAQQSANGSIGSSQRVVLNKEYSELDKEIRRIAATTEFNGIKLLSGTKSNRAITNATNVSGAVGAYGSSGDGRYLTTYNATTSSIEQLDSETGITTVIATGATSTGFVRSSASGERVVFQSTGNINGLNPGGSQSLFLYDRNTQSLTKVVSNSGVSDRFREIAISADGSTIAFRSDSSLNSDGSVYAAATPTIHTYNIATGVFERLNYTMTQTSSTLAISADGSYVTFGESNNILGTNSDVNLELYSFRTGSAASTLRQLTSTSGLNAMVLGSGPNISNSGDLYFVSTANYVTGGNSSNRNQVFKYNNATSGFEQLTNNSSTSTFDNLTLTNDGSQILFRTNANLTGENSSGNYQIYKYDLLANSFFQTTNYSDATLNSGSGFSISNDGNTFYSVSTQLRAVDISAGDFNLDIEAGAGSLGSISTALEAINGSLRGLGSHTLTTQSSARGALDAILLNIQKLGSLQGVVGAGQSRLETAAKLLLGQRQETAAARSRITDADIAEEAASANRNQILQQAATAVLAQANLQPQIALTLLQG